MFFFQGAARLVKRDVGSLPIAPDAGEKTIACGGGSRKEKTKC
jgi:hypothetical protein